MDYYISAKEAAALWNLSERRVTGLCKEQKIEGAFKKGRSWMIPVDAVQPVDKRRKKCISADNNTLALRPLPIGVSDYRLAVSKYYYVDKTMLIKDFLDELSIVSLFTRPRRFGKTLNMDMLRTYLEKSDEDTSVYFRDKKIWRYGKKYQAYQGKYPVIFLTFKDIKKSTWEETYKHMIQIITLEYKRHSELADSMKINDNDYYTAIISGTLDPSLYDTSLFMLSKMLHEHHEIAPIIIIDEYDTPIQQGHMCGFYDNIILFMRNLFSGCFKDNRHLSYGFMTGILRVAKESIFSGLNNLKINSVLYHKYSEYFGFTTDEVREMAKYYSATEKYDEICAWYDGYRFGKTDIFNPWSVINYFNNDCKPQAFWQSTGSNDIISEILSEADEEIYERLSSLLQGRSILSYIDTGVIYPEIKSNPSSIYSFLLVAGYLKVVRSSTAFTGDYMCELALPNKEIKYVYNREILQKLNHVFPQATAVAIQEALYCGNVLMLQKQIKNLLLHSVSYYDIAGETFYHGLVLGLCAALDDRYFISSNRESGDGRYDIQLMPGIPQLPGILIELKADKNCSNLKDLAERALKQITDKNYDTEMKAHGINKIFKYGVAFSGKHVEIAFMEES